MPHIAHVQIRNRGTVGGSLAHADPAAELPAVMVALDANFRLRSRRGKRTVRAEDFYVGIFATELQPDEILAEIVVQPPLPRTGWAFQEIARRRGDYALVGVAATVTLAADDRCSAVRLIYFSVGEGPTTARAAQAALVGHAPGAAAIAEAAHLAAHADIESLGDIHATPAYRRHLIEVLGRRVLAEAVQRAAA
jgi:carbon-monoxide dehydrogenase medium subunit